MINNQYEPIAANNIAFDTLWLLSEVLGLELHIISGELRFRVPETGEFLKTHKEENLGRLAAESTLRQLGTPLLNSGTSLEQVAQMMNLSTVEGRRLVGENF